MSTYFPKGHDNFERKWFVVDATGIPVGRLSTAVADILAGKTKPTWTPFLDMGDHVVVINASQVKVSGKKADKKEYIWHSRYYGGMKTRPYKKQMEIAPDQAVLLTVKGMLPKTKYGRKLLTRVRVFAGAEHTLQGQQPSAKA